MILTKEEVSNIDIDHIINSKIKSDSLETILLVVPTNRKARYLKKELIDLSNNQSASKINIETIGTLTEKLLGHNTKYNLLSDSAATVFIDQSVNKKDLKYFSSYKDEIPTGTLDKIKNVISEYKKQGITPGILRSEAQKLEFSEKLKAEDIANIYEKFSAKCAKVNALQTGDIYLKLLQLNDEEFSEVFGKEFTNIDLIVINGFAEFTLPEIKVINLLSTINSSRLFINFDYYNYNPQVFSYLDNCYEKFLEFGFKKVTDDSENNQRHFIKALRESVFRETDIKFSNFSDVVKKITAADRIQEIEIIAKEIKKLIIEENVKPSDICVAFNTVGNYSEIVRDVFFTHKIPVNLTDRISLDTSPAVISIISFLEIIENDYYYKNIIRALSSGFISVKNVELNSIINSASALKIISGKSLWKLTLKEAIENADNDHPKLKEHFINAEYAIEKIESYLKPFSKELSISDFYNHLKKMIFDLGVVDNILEKSNGEEEENIKALTSFMEMVEEICELLKIEVGAEEKFPLSYFLKHIKLASIRYRYNVKEKSDYGVLITAVNEIRGLQFEYLFLGGLVDGDFPTKYNPEIFFSGSFARKEEEHQKEERYHFYQALCSWKKKIYLCTSLFDKDRELEESIFLKEFQKLYQTSELTIADFENTIFTDEDNLINLGRQILNGSIPNEITEKLKIEIDAINSAVLINESRKWSDGKYQDYNGVLDYSDKDINSELEKLSDKEFSVSQLEVYAKCPFKFFLERLLRIESIEEPSDEVEAIEVGNILHQILFEFYSKLKKEGLELQHCDGQTFLKCKDILFEISEKHLSNAAFRLPLSFIEKEKIFGSAERKDSSLLYKFLEYERNSEVSEKPKYFEAAFGSVDKKDTDDDLSVKEPILINNIKLRGKIDRVEVNESSKLFNIVDYKTGGKKPTANELKGGLSLQLPIYLYAVEAMLYKKYGEEFKPASMIIYSLKYNEDSFGRLEVKYDRKKTTPDELKKQVMDSTKFLSEYVENIAEGKFGLSSLVDRETQICRFCDFKNICRITSLNKCTS